MIKHKNMIKPTNFDIDLFSYLLIFSKYKNFEILLSYLRFEKINNKKYILIQCLMPVLFLSSHAHM